MEAMKGTTGGEDLYERISTAVEQHKLWWDKLFSLITDGSPSLTGKILGPSRRVEDSLREIYPNRETFLSLHYSPGGILQNCFKYEHSAVMKLVDFLRPTGLTTTDISYSC